MNYTAIAIVVAVSATIASFVSFISQIILSRQERLAKQLQQMAGIIKIERKESKHPSQLTQLLNENEPTTSLRVQVSSGASFLQQNLVSLRNMLARGIRIQFLLFNPNTDSKLLEENPNLF
jgi:predicted PurR-regulated permease PerM